MKISDPKACTTLRNLEAAGYLSVEKRVTIERLFADAVLARAGDLAETIHLHIKVDDTRTLPKDRFLRDDAILDHEKEGFVKFRFPGGINVIFSHIVVAEEERVETIESRRKRPFVDHVGIDLREENESTRELFDSLPELAQQRSWPVASQGGQGRAVFCCHVEVSAKHWLYPPAADGGIPLEFAYGPLRVNPTASGCDLRPADPNKVGVGSLPSCCDKSTDEGQQTKRC